MTEITNLKRPNYEECWNCGYEFHPGEPMIVIDVVCHVGMGDQEDTKNYKEEPYMESNRFHLTCLRCVMSGAPLPGLNVDNLNACWPKWYDIKNMQGC